MKIFVKNVLIQVIYDDTIKCEKIKINSPLHNPFQINYKMSRDRIIGEYREWINEQIKNKNQKICKELEKLRKKAIKNGELKILGCHGPSGCHSSIVASIIAKAVYDNIKFLVKESKAKIKHNNCPKKGKDNDR